MDLMWVNYIMNWADMAQLDSPGMDLLCVDYIMNWADLAQLDSPDTVTHINP